MGIYMIYDWLAEWWVIDYIIIRCYGWNQYIIFSKNKTSMSRLLELTLLLRFV